MASDIRKEYHELFEATTKAIDTLDIPEMQFIVCEGIGNPQVLEFKQKSKALQIMSKAIRNYFRDQYEELYQLSPLEGVWDTYDNSKFDVTRKKMIKYTLMISQPDLLTQEIFDEIKQSLLEKKNHAPYIEEIYLTKITEGKSIQMLHIGPYNTEIITTKEIMEYIIVQNMKLNGMHHEIYLNNPERVAPEKLKTIVRYAVTEV